MKRLFIVLCLISLTPTLARADTTTINARILPTIWYSSLSAQAGDTVRMYAGIQNDSGITFSGKADFSVDGTLLKSVPFQSKSGTIEKVGTDWTAVAGKSAVAVTITTNLDADQALVSVETDTSHYSVEKKITFETVTASVKATLGPVASDAVEKLDTITADASTKLDSFKKPEQKEGSTLASGRVLGTSTMSDKLAMAVSPAHLNTLWNKATNASITALQFLLAHWKWSLSGIGVISLAFVFLRR